MIQTALPCILFAHKESQLTLIGGTDAEMAPPIGYVQQILKPILCQFGVQFQCDVIKRFQTKIVYIILLQMKMGHLNMLSGNLNTCQL